MKDENKVMLISVIILVPIVFVIMGLSLSGSYAQYEETVIIEEIKYGTVGNEFKCNSTLKEDWIQVYFKIGNIDVGDLVKIYWVKEGLYGMSFLDLTGWKVDELVLMS